MAAPRWNNWLGCPTHTGWHARTGVYTTAIKTPNVCYHEHVDVSPRHVNRLRVFHADSLAFVLLFPGISDRNYDCCGSSTVGRHEPVGGSRPGKAKHPSVSFSVLSSNLSRSWPQQETRSTSAPTAVAPELKPPRRRHVSEKPPLDPGTSSLLDNQQMVATA
ncbi:unnamed protein product [Ectocarpus sp. 12 AP-2014]